MNISYKKLINDSLRLGEKILTNKTKQYDSIFGIPSGGVLPAYVISQILGLPLIKFPMRNTLIVDDILDSGKTLFEWQATHDTAVLYNKGNSSINPTYCVEKLPSDEWVLLPHEKQTGIEDHITRMFEYIGENPNREGLKETPKRIVKMWNEIFRGYRKEDKPKITVFNNKCDGIHYDQMIVDSGTGFSMCEHHMAPFEFSYDFAYIPGDKVLGLSKVARIVDYYAAKLQVQERLVKEIVDELEKELQPKAIGLVIKGRHLCKSMRGVKKEGKMITSDLRGLFKTEPETRAEFLSLVVNK